MHMFMAYASRQTGVKRHSSFAFEVFKKSFLSFAAMMVLKVRFFSLSYQRDSIPANQPKCKIQGQELDRYLRSSSQQGAWQCGDQFFIVIVRRLWLVMEV